MADPTNTPDLDMIDRYREEFRILGEGLRAALDAAGQYATQIDQRIAELHQAMHTPEYNYDGAHTVLKSVYGFTEAEELVGALFNGQ